MPDAPSLEPSPRLRPRWAVLGLLLALLLLCACDKKNQPIAVGFLGGVSGRVADLGIAGRDGVILAVEEQNRAGGIAGRPLELLIADDRQDPDVARDAVNYLIDEKAAAIIGPMTSSIAMATVPVVNQRQVPMISPTVSATDLTGMDDYFFRLYPASAQTAERLARYLADELGLRRVNCVIDLANRAHTESMLRHFARQLEALGGEVGVTVSYFSNQKPRFMTLARELVAGDPQALFILANALDTALISQQLHKLDAGVPIFTSEWSATVDILEYGGRTVEGLRFFHTFDHDYPAESFQTFRRAFRERFGYEASFASAHAYDAARVLFAALAESGDGRPLRQILAQPRTVQGLQSEIRFDGHGDVTRRHFLMIIRNGAFHSLAQEP